MLKTRVLTAVVLVALVLAALFGLDARGWAAVTLMIVVIAASEWAKLAGYRPQARWLFVAATALIGISLLFMQASGFSTQDAWPQTIVLSICGAATLFWLLVVPPWLYFGWRVESRMALAVIGWLVLIATWVAVVQVQARSPGLLLALMAIVWIADTAAYFVGRRYGRRKLAPAISPGKTWEGVYGALGAAGIYAVVLLPWLSRGGYARELTLGVAAGWIAMVWLLVTLSIAGDLFESQLKRQRGVKDSGQVFPGHGGVLDRIDALTSAMPAAALMAHYVIR
jgi:phosphatidate cytidylyltransferase